MNNYPDDVRGADVERAHGGPDLFELFDEVQARECMCCWEALIPASKHFCAECEDDDNRQVCDEDHPGSFGEQLPARTVYACRRCDAWVEYAETGPHIAHHERNDAGRDRDDE